MSQGRESISSPGLLCVHVRCDYLTIVTRMTLV
jgi:hypothetical protein